MRSDSGLNANGWLVNAVQRKAFDCCAETVRMEAVTFYYNDRSADPMPAEKFPSAWTPVAPDATENNEMQFICAWKPK
jgi:hypothetical protein